MIRVRIAPSPTGYLHVGTARAALFNFLFARQQKGTYILRLEDTDKERSKEEFEKSIYESLEWLGLSPDEGPLRGGSHAPYRDSERIAEHTDGLRKLLNEGKAFYCSHASEEHAQTAHWCSFRDGGETKGIIRFKAPQDNNIRFEDVIRGEVVINTNTFGDFSIARNLESPLYNFSVTIDDAAMEISHVIRGEDHLANTPKQLLLQEALGFSSPVYGHLPLLLGTDRSKLSKRHGATSVTEFKTQGYLPEALVNFLALLGWNPGTEQELFSMDELIKEFSLEKVQKSGAIFDVPKLDWMNGEYIRKKSVTELTALCIPYIEEHLKIKVDGSEFSNEYVENVVMLEQPRLKKLSEIGERVEYFFRDPDYPQELLIWKKMTTDEIITSLDKSERIISSIEFPADKAKIEGAFLTEIGEGDKGSLLWPLRVALTGKKASPGPFEILSILPKEKILQRIAHAKKLSSSR